jgi:hypothetical protein
MKKLALLMVAALVGSVLLFGGPVRSQGWKEKVRKNAHRIPNNYIVVLDDAVIGERGDNSIAGYMADDMARLYHGKLGHVYKHALNGFSVEMSEADAEALSQDYRVLFVEEDGVMTCGCDPDESAVGSGSHRPAQSSAERHLHLQLDRFRCARLRD